MPCSAGVTPEAASVEAVDRAHSAAPSRQRAVHWREPGYFSRLFPHLASVGRRPPRPSLATPPTVSHNTEANLPATSLAGGRLNRLRRVGSGVPAVSRWDHHWGRTQKCAVIGRRVATVTRGW